MLRVDSEALRRRQLIDATIDAIAEVGFAQATLGTIARRAGVSPGLVAHYFANKEGLLGASMRRLVRDLGSDIRRRLARLTSPRERIQAVIDVNLDPAEFDRRTATVWLAFWAQVPHSPVLARIQRAYKRRTESTLVHALVSLAPRPEARRLAHAIAALIDGVWLRAALGEGEPDAGEAAALASAFVDSQLALIRLAGLRMPEGAGEGRRRPDRDAP
jgi:transcriptional repressor BetI